MNNPLVSILIPLYNAEKYIEETLLSVQKQEYENFECLILNDGSSDDSGEIVNKIIAKDPRFYYFEQINRGLSATRNFLLSKSNGRYIQFLDSDDILAENKISKQIEFIKSFSEKVLCYTNFFYGDGENICKIQPNVEDLELNNDDRISDFILRWESQMSIPSHSFLFDSRFINDDNIRFDENLKSHEDFDFWLEILKTKPRVIFLNEFLCTYRNTPNSMSKNMKTMGVSFLQVLNKQMDKNSDYYRSVKLKRRRVLVFYRKFGELRLSELIMEFKSVIIYYLTRIFQRIFQK